MEPPSTVAVQILNCSGRRVPTSRLRKVLQHVLSATTIHNPQSTIPVELLLTDDSAIRDLNRTSRAVDEPTDVLTFPAPAFKGAPWGEIAISVEYAERQAQTRGISLSDELCYLAMHGALHLLGFDDIKDDDRQRMFAEMHRLGQELGLPEQAGWTSILHADDAEAKDRGDEPTRALTHSGIASGEVSP